MDLTDDDRELVERVQRAHGIVMAALGDAPPDVVAATMYALEARQTTADEIAADEDAMHAARVEAAWQAWAAAPVRSLVRH